MNGPSLKNTGQTEPFHNAKVGSHSSLTLTIHLVSMETSWVAENFTAPVESTGDYAKQLPSPPRDDPLKSKQTD